jgi:hypothetical protein
MMVAVNSRKTYHFFRNLDSKKIKHNRTIMPNTMNLAEKSCSKTRDRVEILAETAIYVVFAQQTTEISIV